MSNGEPESSRPGENREIRFGLVLYGGVSLAVYIYGVVYEFQRLVRASRGIEQNAWTGVLEAAGASATVDIVSGASAGGINGVLLGKALVRGADLRTVRSLWIDDAEMGSLLHAASEPEPQSLLQSKLFRSLLDDGLARMDQGSTEEPLVSAFDAFVAGTRLRPWVRDFPTDLGGRIRTSDYRKSFHLKFRHQGYNPVEPDLGYEHDDFAPDQNPVLADVAQATSAFPVAFEPVAISVDERNEHLFDDEEPRSGYFSDGGILHNKPFTETIDTILTRSAGRPVERWLVSVEPDPEHTVPPGEDEGAPEVPEVLSKAAIGIPRYQSVAADLARLHEHRGRADRARRRLEAIDRALLTQIAEIIEGRNRDEGRGEGQEGEDLRRWQVAILAASDYPGERRRSFAESLAARLSRRLPNAAREAGAEALGVAALELDDEAVWTCDPDFEQRRIYHLLEMMRPLVHRREDGELREAVAELQLRLWAQFDRVDDTVWEVFEREPPSLGDMDLGDAGPIGPVREAVARLSEPLADVRTVVRESCEALDLKVEFDERTPRFSAVFSLFELWDAQLLTIGELSETHARDRIGLARVSPGDAQFIQKPSALKLAGDSLGHFGGFLDREWRRNDLLWGRLDAAETISRILMQEAGGDQQALARQIEAAQAEVFHEELPDAQGDYRNYMENRHTVGGQTLADIPMEKRTNLVLQTADVVRNMLGGLADGGGSGVLGRLFGALAKVLGFVLFFLRWPVRAIWDDDRAVRRGASLAILFIGLWSLVTLGLVAIGAVGTTSTLWTLIAGGLAIFVAWGALRSFLR